MSAAVKQYGIPPALLISLVAESPGRDGVSLSPAWRQTFAAQGIDTHRSACTNTMAAALVLRTALNEQPTIHDGLLVFSPYGNADEADAFAVRVLNTMRRLAEAGAKTGLSGLAGSRPDVSAGLPTVQRVGSIAAQWNSRIEKAAAAAGLAPGLIHAVVRAESGYNPQAISPKGAGGLMQLMPATAKRYGVTDRFNPEQNLAGGARYLRDLLILFNHDVRLALAAYNAGEGNVMRYGNKIPPFAETQNYVPKVIAYWLSHNKYG